MTSAFLLHIVSSVCMLLMASLGYNVVFGKGKILHFGPIAVSVMATYGLAITLAQGGGWLVGLSIAFILSMAVSALFAWLSFRMEPDGLGILTIAVHFGFIAVVLNWSSLTRGALGIPRIPRMPFLQSPVQFAIAVVIITVLWIAFLLWIDRGSLGRRLTALSENEWHAQAIGINRKRVHMLAFLIAGVGAWLSNIFYIQYVGLAHPNDLAFPFAIFYIVCVVAGKPGSVLGVTLATTLLTLLKEGLRFVPLPLGMLGPVRLILFGVILLAVVWFRRKDLFPMARTV
jgi:branched-chain amino acid transport system permease protein